MFKAGDRVKCVEKDPLECVTNRVTFGKVYLVLDVAGAFVVISDDDGSESSVYGHRFVLADTPKCDGRLHAGPCAALPTDSTTRKNLPIATGALGYFPLAIAYVALVSKVGNEQHNPGQPMHWAREKSTDHPDCIARHLMERGTVDTDKLRHSGKLAWRGLANLQQELEEAIARGENPFEVKP